MDKEFDFLSVENEWVNAFITPDILRSGKLNPKIAAQVLLLNSMVARLSSETLALLCSMLVSGEENPISITTHAEAYPILLTAVEWEIQDSALNRATNSYNDCYLGNIYQKRLIKHYESNPPQNIDEFLELAPVKVMFESLNDDYRDAFYRYLLLVPKLNLAQNFYNRRSCHANNPYVFIKIHNQILFDFCIFQHFGCDLSSALTDPQIKLDNYGFYNGYAYYAGVLQTDEAIRHLAEQSGSKYINNLIPRDGVRLLAELEKNFFASEGISSVSRAIIKGLIASGVPKALELVMNLLKAAKLSEGLRTSIVEEIDAGSVETFKYFLAYIDQSNLYRFSSVQRSFITFSGLYEQLTNKTIPKHAKWLAEGMLNDKAEEYLTEKNYVKFYLGLYLMSCHSIENTVEIISERLLSWDKHQQVAAIFFLKQTASTPFPGRFITDLLQQLDKSKIDQELAVSVLSDLNNIIFHSRQEKHDFLSACLPIFTEIKSSSRYYTIFGEGDRPYNSYMMSKVYRFILDLVDEVDDFYEIAYSVFSKHWSSSYYYPYQNPDMIKRLKNPIVHKTVVKAVGSRISDEAKNLIISNNVDLSHEDYLTIGDFLRLKSSAVRANVSELLAKAEPNTIIEIAVSALRNRNKNKREGAIGILIDNYEQIKHLPSYTEVKELLANTDFDVTVAQQVEKLLGKTESSRSTKADFYTPVEEIPCPQLTWDKEIVQDYLNYDLSALFDFVIKCYEIFIRHHGEEIEVPIYNGSKEIKRIGFDILTVRLTPNFTGEDYSYRDYLFYEDFIPLTEKLSNKDCLLYQHFLSVIDGYTRHNNDFKSRIIDYGIEHGYLPNLHPWVEEWSSKNTQDTDQEHYIDNAMIVLCMESKRRGLYVDAGSVSVAERKEINRYFAHLTAYHITKEKERVAAGVALPIEAAKTATRYTYFSDMRYVAGVATGVSKDTFPWFDNHFIKALALNLLNLQSEEEYLINVTMLFKLEDLGLISRDLLYTLILDPNCYSSDTFLGDYPTSRVSAMISEISGLIRNAEFSYGKDWHTPLPYPETIMEVYRNCANHLVNIELGRTDADTPYSKAVSNCREFYGAEIFFKTLSQMGKITFERGYSWRHQGKKEIFSKIISRTIPDKDLTQEQFNHLKAKYKISNERLLEACMYNLRFIEYAESYLGLPGLMKAAYYFKAHLNDTLKEKEKAVVRRFSDIEFEDFQNGQMDLNWFNESYTELGEENFEWLYQAAKYITDGSKHKRAQYFADAVRGKLNIDEVEARISDKRNQEMILAYGLIPLGAGKSEDIDEDACLRYTRLQAFLKESKQFGAQRRASEALKVSIALNNLARNYGLPATRFIWKMEAKLSQSQASYFIPHELDEFTTYIDLERPEKPELRVYKAGKLLKSIPGKISKDPYIKELKTVKIEIKDQYRRAHTMLEKSMCSRTEFTPQELDELATLPIVAALLRDLLFISGSQVGFYQDGNLKMLVQDRNETFAQKIDAKAKLRIAHPVDLVEQNWAAWQEYVMTNQIIQPFKQVFRELYVMTAEECKADGYSQRFAGYQVAKSQALGLLSSRGWMLNDGGFEKVDHQSGLRIELYCYADWYTAADVEEPSLEKVVFLDNKTGKTWDMARLDPVIFSETMRDLDLVVSVAHVGGVDPFYEHTTIELRARILTHNLELLGIKNYRVDGMHVTIQGRLHEYSMHLGSGVIHVSGRGMLPVFPVHSQQRGRIFLPFVDSDPKTAEIVTKALLLADDTKIKDPTILAHLR